MPVISPATWIYVHAQSTSTSSAFEQSLMYELSLIVAILQAADSCHKARSGS
jgi:hypothetical protein